MAYVTPPRRATASSPRRWLARARLSTAWLALACTAPASAPDAALGPSDGGRPRPDAPFVRPDAGVLADGAVAPAPGSCGLEAAAFCDTFEAGPPSVTRAGELDPTRWSVGRMKPTLATAGGHVVSIGPSRLPACRPGRSGEIVVPDDDVVICEPVAEVASRHVLIAAAAQDYGVHSLRVRQPFDFGGRTGRVVFDADLSFGGLLGWLGVSISEDPTPTPSYLDPERGAGPRNGVDVEFEVANPTGCGAIRVHGFHEFAQSVIDGEQPSCPETSPGALNHVELYLTSSHLEVWASDPSADGRVFPNFRQVYEADVDLGFTRGYVNLNVHNHATIKYWGGAAKVVRLDNVGFDGPVVAGWAEHSVPDSLVPGVGTSGCLIGGVCQWVDDVVRDHGQDVCDDRPSGVTERCDYPADTRDLGYRVPDAAAGALSLSFDQVDTSGLTRARLAFTSWYPGAQGDVSGYVLRHRWNGGAWHDRPLTEGERRMFVGGYAQGMLNQVVEVDPAELVPGTNTVELSTREIDGGGYPTAVLNVDLVLER